MKTLEFNLKDFERLGIKEYPEVDGYKVIGIGNYRYMCLVEGEVYKVVMAYTKEEAKERWAED